MLLFLIVVTLIKGIKILAYKITLIFIKLRIL
jgi:hypothetical protein